ncbi:hypothetical protein VMCG_06407 [Cytospora schulzeri]|uniref:NACHT domain-containing protein n=1 Tax=Cytospora schulzeri TaxID=448051 RepID=A0A423W7Z2_9PEZI|nr:hypothetical protein VMCG_06407 [Valsa malicola]
MDPSSAFGLSASILQFITFTVSLINQSIDIHDSANGLSNQLLDIEDTYRDLCEFSLKFETTCRGSGDVDVHAEIHEHVAGLEALAKDCQDDCRILLDVIGKLKIEDGPRRRWKSFKAAFVAYHKGDKIENLEKRLERIQGRMTTYMCRISNYYHALHTDELKQLREESRMIRVDQDEKLKHLESMLISIKAVLEAKDNNAPGSISTATPLSLPEIQSIAQSFANLEIIERVVLQDQMVLRSLAFEQHEQRHNSIPKAHQQTLSWIFDPANHDSEGTHLLAWLRSGRGIFWVSGKPGSGKSTLMKFLADNPQTQIELSAWAGRKKVVTTSHFFWWSGTPMQKSQEGLLRALLLGILKRCPELIQESFMEHCPVAIKGHDHGDIRHWALEDLESVVDSLARHQDQTIKFCMFIDGLDEYDGDHEDICKTLQKLVKLSLDIKICVSSRPWNVFEHAFGHGNQKIYVQNLTKDDIRRYTHTRLSEHQAWEAVSARDPEARQLVELITQRADGVFLWVFLVTKALRTGLNNHDSLTDLYRRVEAFPADLYRFFEQMLRPASEDDGFYNRKMSTSLQIALAAKRPLNLSIYAFNEEILEDTNYAIDLPVSRLGVDGVKFQHSTVAIRLNGWCKGLLEVHGHDVHFLHRTVVEFLETKEMSDFLARTSPGDFYAPLSILKAYVAWMKTSPQPNRDVHCNTLNNPDPMTNAEESLGVYSSQIAGTTLSYIDMQIQEILTVASEIDTSVGPTSPLCYVASTHLDAVDWTIKILGDMSGLMERRTLKEEADVVVLCGSNEDMYVSPRDSRQVIAEGCLVAMGNNNVDTAAKLDIEVFVLGYDTFTEYFEEETRQNLLDPRNSHVMHAPYYGRWQENGPAPGR